MTDYARYRCVSCERQWDAELPPLWSAFDRWPECCDQRSFLLAPLEPTDEALLQEDEAFWRLNES